MSTPKNKAFQPRAGMRFKLNNRRLNRIVVLVKPVNGGRYWEANSVSNFGKFRIPAAKLHAGLYHDGWSLYVPENES